MGSRDDRMLLLLLMLGADEMLRMPARTGIPIRGLLMLWTGMMRGLEMLLPMRRG